MFNNTVAARLNEKGKDLSNSLNVFPNPTTNRVSINWNNEALNLSLHKVSVTNVFGRKVAHSIVNNNSVDFSSIPSGVYILEIVIEGESMTERIIKN